MKTLTLLLIAGLVVVACKSPGAKPAPAAGGAQMGHPTSADGSATSPETFLPTPYTAEQLRAACPDGMVVRYRLRADGQVMWMEMGFDDGDAEGTFIETQRLQEDGRPLEMAEVQKFGWEELRDHAKFPDSVAARSDGGEVRVPAGSFKVVRYTVEDGTKIAQYDFAPSLPGPPVLMVVRAGDQEVFRMELVERGMVGTLGAWPPSLPEEGRGAPPGEVPH
jgi:hypothetical protein